MSLSFANAFRVHDELPIHERERLGQDIGAIMAWVNTYLKQRSCPANSIETDFRDGVRVIVLLEVAFNTQISSYNSRPRLPFHCLDNLAIAFKFCSDHGISLINIDPHSIMIGVVKPTLNLFRSILRALTIKKLKDFCRPSGSLSQSDEHHDSNSSGPSFRAQLLQWVSQTFAGIVPNVQIDNFWSSFKDGVVFCGLIESLVPGSIDLDTIQDQDSSENLALAFRVSEERLGIPAVLCPEDFRSERKPDEAAVELYISMLVSAAAANRKRDLSALEQVNSIRLKKEMEMEQIKERMEESERRIREMMEARDMSASKEKMLQDQLESDGLALAQYRSKYDQLLEHSQKNHALLQQLSASEKDLRNRVSDLEAALQQRENSVAELQAENSRLKAEVYATHIEAMDIQKRFQPEEKRPELDKDDSSSTQYESTSVKVSKVDLRAVAAGLIASSSSRQGWLMIRKIGGGFFVKPKVKKRFFELRGDCLVHSDKKPITSSSCKIIKLSHYQKLEIESDIVDLYEDFKQLLNEKPTPWTSDSAPYESHAGAATTDAHVVLRLIPKPHRTGLNSYEISAVQSFNAEVREDVHIWRQEINDQIALHDYMKDVNEGVACICKEIVEFVANPSRTNLSICDRSKDLHRVLTHFKESLILRKNLSLSIENVALSLSSLQIIGEIVARNQSIQAVDLPNNQITSKTVRPLADALKVNRSVQEVNLINNMLKDEGVMMLSDALAYHPRLQALRLSGNGITCIGVSSLCNAIRSSSDRFRWEHVFPCLDLSHNCIADRGAESIANLIRCNTSLTRLLLNRNQISDTGLSAISLAIRLYPRPIEEIRFAQNKLTSRGVASLAEALQDLESVHKIDLSRNQMIGRSGIMRLLHVDVPIKFEAFVIVRGNISRDRNESCTVREDQ